MSRRFPGFVGRIADHLDYQTLIDWVIADPEIKPFVGAQLLAAHLTTNVIPKVETLADFTALLRRGASQQADVRSFDSLPPSRQVEPLAAMGAQASQLPTGQQQAAFDALIEFAEQYDGPARLRAIIKQLVDALKKSVPAQSVWPDQYWPWAFRQAGYSAERSKRLYRASNHNNTVREALRDHGPALLPLGFDDQDIQTISWGGREVMQAVREHAPAIRAIGLRSYIITLIARKGGAAAIVAARTHGGALLEAGFCDNDISDIVVRGGAAEAVRDDSEVLVLRGFSHSEIASLVRREVLHHATRLAKIRFRDGRTFTSSQVNWLLSPSDRNIYRLRLSDSKFRLELGCADIETLGEKGYTPDVIVDVVERLGVDGLRDAVKSVTVGRAHITVTGHQGTLSAPPPKGNVNDSARATSLPAKFAAHNRHEDTKTTAVSNAPEVPSHLHLRTAKWMLDRGDAWDDVWTFLERAGNPGEQERNYLRNIDLVPEKWTP
jgi:hypothetical protein